MIFTVSCRYFKRIPLNLHIEAPTSWTHCESIRPPPCMNLDSFTLKPVHNSQNSISYHLSDKNIKRGCRKKTNPWKKNKLTCTKIISIKKNISQYQNNIIYILTIYKPFTYKKHQNYKCPLQQHLTSLRIDNWCWDDFLLHLI